MAMTAAELIKADQDHLIHPLHHPIDNAEPIIYVRGRGAMVAGHRRPRVYRRPVGPVERQRRPRPRRAGRRGRGADEGARLLLGLRRLVERPGDRAGRAADRARRPRHAGASSSPPAAPRRTSRRSRRRASTGRRKGKPDKVKIIARQQAYHGVTLQAMSATGMGRLLEDVRAARARLRAHPDLLSVPLSRARKPGETAGQAAARRAGGSDPARGRRHGRRVHRRADPRRRRRALSRPTTTGRSCARSAPPRRAAHRRRGHHRLLPHRAVVRPRALERASPTSCSFAKGVTSGYLPLGGIMVSARDQGGDRRGRSPKTAGCTPTRTRAIRPAARSASKNIEIMERERLLGERRRRWATGSTPGSQQAFGDHPHVGDIRGGKGLLAAVELVEDRATKANFSADKKSRRGCRPR